MSYFVGGFLGSGEEDEKPEHLMDSVRHEDKNELMKCFQCDLGFWDVCYTTKTICTLEERCFTGRGKAGLTKGMFFLLELLLHFLSHKTLTE